jgi:hypothetical protein
MSGTALGQDFLSQYPRPSGKPSGKDDTAPACRGYSTGGLQVVRGHRAKYCPEQWTDVQLALGQTLEAPLVARGTGEERYVGSHFGRGSKACQTLDLGPWIPQRRALVSCEFAKQSKQCIERSPCRQMSYGS